MPFGLKLISACACLAILLPASLHAKLIVSPQVIECRRPEASQQVIVWKATSTEDGQERRLDVTRAVTFKFADPGIASVDALGLVRPMRDGATTLSVTVGDETALIPVHIQGLQTPPPVSFQNEVQPILTKARCNSGGCHGKAEGQNGFKLSLFGFDNAADLSSLTQESRGRRISLTQPERSLLLLKATSEMPHGGGRKIDKGSGRYQRLLRWIREGAQPDTSDDAGTEIVGIEVEPSEVLLLAGEQQQIRVTAIDGAGHRHGVTIEADFDSNAPAIAEADQRGLITASDIPGQAAILVRYLGHVAACRITLPRPDTQFDRPAENNFVDGLVWNQLQQLGIPASGLSSDSEFLRRVHLDTIGTLPTAQEAREFLADQRPDKRSRLTDRLLERDEYADYWTMKWLDLLRADQLAVTPQGTVAMQRWLRKHFQQNRPFDQLARELLTVQGSTQAEGPGAFYKALKKPDELSRSVSQLFLGVRIECAQCHHHPSERWSQADYTGLAGFFTGVKLKRLPNGNDAIVAHGGKDLPHPRTGELVPATALGADAAELSPLVDRRSVLADWMTAPDNPFFARAIANRLWAHYFGRGLVEPVDDLRDTNPASNEPLMQALTDHMREVQFDLKAFTRTLLNSRVYQLSSEPSEANRDDEQNFSHAVHRTLPAEVLLDAICQSTGVQEEFNGWPSGYRAIQIWDNRMPSYFFRIFGRPVRATVCECERSGEPSIAQALHLLNSPEIMAKIQDRDGVARRLAASDMSIDDILDELYLSTLSRSPTTRERTLMKSAFQDPSSTRRSAVEDVLWAILNSKEFMFNH
ncbi:MAG: DUF1549 domain-containing protein [Planctomycetota bacterium]|jgi:hypothetical protein